MGSDRATGGPTPASAAGLHDCLWRLRHNRDSAAKALCPCFSTSGTGAQGPMAQCCHQFQVGGQRHRPGHGPGDCPESQADPTGREGLVEKGRMDFASVCSTCHNQTPQTGWLTRQTCVVSHCGRQIRGRGAGGLAPSAGCRGGTGPRPLSLACRWPPSPFVFTWHSLSVHVCFSPFSDCDTIPMGLRPTPKNPYEPRYLL